MKYLICVKNFFLKCLKIILCIPLFLVRLFIPVGYDYLILYLLSVICSLSCIFLLAYVPSLFFDYSIVIPDAVSSFIEKIFPYYIFCIIIYFDFSSEKRNKECKELKTRVDSLNSSLSYYTEESESNIKFINELKERIAELESDSDNFSE